MWLRLQPPPPPDIGGWFGWCIARTRANRAQRKSSNESNNGRHTAIPPAAAPAAAARRQVRVTDGERRPDDRALWRRCIVSSRARICTQCVCVCVSHAYYVRKENNMSCVYMRVMREDLTHTHTRTQTGPQSPPLRRVMHSITALLSALTLVRVCVCPPWLPLRGHKLCMDVLCVCVCASKHFTRSQSARVHENAHTYTQEPIK